MFDKYISIQMYSNSTKTHCCIPCGYLCSSRSNLVKHFSTKKHIKKIQNPDAVIVGGFKCPNCDKMYKSNPGLWAHKKKCKLIAVAVAVAVPPETDLRAEIKNLKVMIIEMAKNLQPITINNSINSNNNYINIFLNDKCHNAYDIKKFIAGIDFSKENFEKLIQDYVGGDADIITKNFTKVCRNTNVHYMFLMEKMSIRKWLIFSMTINGL